MNTKNTFFIFLFSLLVSLASAQGGSISGKIIDSQTSEGLQGATVVLLNSEGTIINGAFVGDEGVYSIPMIPRGIYSLRVNLMTYDTLWARDISIIDSEVTKDFSLKMSSMGEENTVVITSRVLRNTETSLLSVQRKSANVVDGMSSQQMNRTGDANVASAANRVSGLSVQGGKYLLVRGLGDRYSKTMLNGANIPGLDPEKNSIQVDLFPTKIIDNLMVYKTFTPDLPGDFTGGLVEISTRQYPEEFLMDVSVSTSFNTLSSFNQNFISGETTVLDRLGLGAKSRQIPRILNGVRVPGLSFSDPVKADKIDQMTNSFSSPMSASPTSSLMDHGFSFSVGNKWDLKGRPLGIIASLNYSTSYDHFGNGKVGRYKLANHVDNTDNLETQVKLEETRSEVQTLLGGLLSASFSPWDGHKFSMNYFHNQSATNNARYFHGTIPEDDPSLFFETRTISFTQRRMDALQFTGRHQFNLLSGLNLNWIASLSSTAQDEPDMRFFSNDYTMVGGEKVYDLQPSLYKAPSRFFRNMKESNADINTHFSLPLSIREENDSKIKFGSSSLFKAREVRENRFEYQMGSETEEYNGNPDEFFSANNLGVSPSWNGSGEGETQYYSYAQYLVDASQMANNYDGTQKIFAAYLMGDLSITPRFKLITGARWENTDIQLKSWDQNLPGADLKKNDILPSLSMVYSPVVNKVKLRGSYSRTIARPTFRELAPFASFNFVKDYVILGNENLERTIIDNVDLRAEYYPSPSELISVSGFFKNFQNPIERVINPMAGNTELNYRNVDNAKLFGLEFEIRKDLSFISPKAKNFRIGANASLVKSFLNINEDELALIHTLNPYAPSQRPIFGQSPYTLNAELSYVNDTLGITTNLNFNIFGRRITAVSAGGSPDVYENPRPVLDYSFSKKFGDRLSVSLRVKNILNPAYQKTQTFEGTEYIFESYNRGQSYSLGASYNF